MASVTEEPQPIPPPQRAKRAEEPLVDRQIRRTRRAIKLVDLTAGLITLAIGILVFLLTMAVLEHWVIPGGWSDTARALLFGTLILGIAAYSWRTFWPLVGQSINPAYAALAIEQHSPSLKNSLLNLLLLRNRKRYLSRQVFQAIEQQAAQRLSKVSLESAVDRSAILRLGYILVAITALCAVYRFLSPKDLIASAGRVLLPWSSIVTPSRVQILNVTPGDTKAARGEQIRIAAEVLGLDEDEPVRLYYSTVDEQIVGAEVLMSASAGGAEFQCRLPARWGVVSSSGSANKTRGGSGRGIQQDFVYWIEAGDARSPRYEVAVFARPTLVVSQLRYDYPAYTGYESRDVEHTGDIRAVEGTQVTLVAQANKPIKTAHVDFEADGRRDLLMSTTDQQATVTFPLTLREDRRTPRYQSYVLRYLTTAGNQNEQPPKYQIDVQPDYAPEIELLLPAEAVLEVALNQEVEFELEARDPDFALSQVLLIGKLGKAELLQEELLSANQSGRFNGKLRKTPQAMGLKVGDVLEYWGVAADNRRPEANLAHSAHRKLRVIDPWQGDQGGEENQGGDDQQQPGEGGEPQAGEGGQEGQAGGGEQGNSGEGEAGSEGEGGSGQQEGEPGEQQEQQQGQGSGGNSSEGEPSDSGESQGNAGGESPASDSDNSRSQQEAGEPADDSTDGEGSEQGKVSSEGDDDGSAFERMAEHFNEQKSDKGQTGTGEPGAGEAADSENQTKSDGKTAENSPATDQADNQTGDGQSGDGDDSESADGEAADKETDPAAADKAAAEPASEAGAAAEEKQAPAEAEKQGGTQQQEGESPDGEVSPEQGSPEQGDAGAGESGGDDQGAAKPEGGKSPPDGQGDSSDAAEQDSSEAPSQGRDQGEQETEGGQSGDRSGGGKEGAGQQAEEDGKGGAGENQPADEGAGQASETGEGETGEQPGGKEKSDGKTGESSGDQAGEGSDQGEQAGDKPGGESASGQPQGEPGAESDAEPGEGQPDENSADPANDQQQPPDQQAPPGESNPAAAEGQAGEPSGTGGNPSAPPPGGETQQGDDANLEYAREQTDLILDRLDDQLKRQDVDKNLLEKLGWSQDELRRFVDRWKNLKMQAADKNSSTESQEELSDALRSLGLGRNRRTGFNSQVTKDQLRDLQDSFRGRVPLEFQEQVRSYVKGTTTSQENE